MFWWVFSKIQLGQIEVVSNAGKSVEGSQGNFLVQGQLGIHGIVFENEIVAGRRRINAIYWFWLKSVVRQQERNFVEVELRIYSRECGVILVLTKRIAISPCASWDHSFQVEASGLKLFFGTLARSHSVTDVRTTIQVYWMVVVPKIN